MKDEQVRRVSSARPEGCTIYGVKELLNQETARWNENILNQLFNEAYIQAIKRTPISIMGLSDKLVWNLTKNGQFSMSSRYKIAKTYKKREKRDEGTSSKKVREKKSYGGRFGAWTYRRKSNILSGEHAIIESQQEPV